MWRSALLCCLVVSVSAIASRDAVIVAAGFQDRGDVIEFVPSGGRLAGRIGNPDELAQNPRSAPIVLETEAGGKIVLDNGSVARVAQSQQSELDAYDAFAADLKDTSEDHWRAVEWCLSRPQGKYALERQIRMHLLRLVELDVNDKKAADALLGLPQPIQLVKRNERWIDERLLMAAHGYRYDRRWGSQLQTAINQELKAREDSKRAFLAAYRKWENRLKNLDAATALRELIQEAQQYPTAIADLNKLAQSEKNPEKRAVLLEAIGTANSQAAANALIPFAMADADERVRDRARALLLQPHYNAGAITDRLRAYLKHSNNEMVNRAANLMSELGTFNSVLPLIDALSTKHTVRNPNAQAPGQSNFSFGNNGIGFQPGGNGQPQTISGEVQNRDVYTALMKITQPLSPPDMGYDEARWSTWYARITTTGSDLRRDD